MGLTVIASGKTTPGATNWTEETGCLRVDVDTSAAKFTTTPNYVVSIGGEIDYWQADGGSGVYDATPTGFTVKVRRANGGALTRQNANDMKWHVNWMAFG